MNREYIEKEALLAQIRESRVNNPHLDSRDRHAHDTEHRHFEYMVFSAKPSDVKPVVRGEWKGEVASNLYRTRICSVCGERTAEDLFCSRCGAEMRKEKDDERGVD